MMSILFFAAFCSSAQKRDISGAWTGYVQTVDMKLTYEVVINDSSGTYVGFSKIIFKVKNKEIFGIKSLAIREEDEKYILEEKELLSDNFEDDAPKKIKQINTLDLQVTNTTMKLSGEFKTNAVMAQTKGGKTINIKAATGEVFLQKTVKPDTSALFATLKEMGKTEDMGFVKKARADSIAAKIGRAHV